MLAFSGLLAWSAGANALPEVTDKKGLSAELSFGAGYLSLKSNTVSGNAITDLENNVLTSNDLGTSPSSRTTIVPVVVNEIRWNFGNRNELFAGESVEDAVTLDTGTQLGWRKGTDNLGTFQVGALFFRLLPTDVYEDPFLTDRKRSKTDAVRWGLRFQWDKIFNTPFEWQLTARAVDVEDDTNGQSLVFGDPDNPVNAPAGVNLITTDQLTLLQRDANEIYTRLSYLFKPAQRHSIRPLIGYTHHDADGEAESFNAIRTQITYAYQTKHLLFVANVIRDDRQFDARNPIYNQYRDSIVTALDSTVLIPLKIADGNWAWYANAFWGEEDSDIDFYDQEGFQLSTGVQYRFVMD
jgi:hypothetical protein